MIGNQINEQGRELKKNTSFRGGKKLAGGCINFLQQKL